MGKLTISLASFYSYVTNLQRVYASQVYAHEPSSCLPNQLTGTQSEAEVLVVHYFLPRSIWIWALKLHGFKLFWSSRSHSNLENTDSTVFMWVSSINLWGLIQQSHCFYPISTGENTNNCQPHKWVHYSDCWQFWEVPRQFLKLSSTNKDGFQLTQGAQTQSMSSVQVGKAQQHGEMVRIRIDPGFILHGVTIPMDKS